MRGLKCGIRLFSGVKGIRVPQLTYQPKFYIHTKDSESEPPAQEPLNTENPLLAKQVKQLEDQLAQKTEQLGDQKKVITKLEEINKDHHQKLKELREALKSEIEEQDLSNKRNQKEKDNLKVFAITNFAKELLDVQDNLERAIESTQGEAKVEENTLLEGVLLTHRILEKVFQKFGVQKMDVMGKKFDPNYHESLFQVQDQEKEADTVCYVAQDGYVIGERVLRPAKVGVVKL